MYTETDESSPSYRLPLRDRLPGRLRAVASLSWWRLALAVLVAVVLGQQILAPNSRVIKAVAGLALFILAYRTKPFWTLCFIVLFFPFPFSIFVGSSTAIFIVLAGLIYLARLTVRLVPPLERTPVDAGIGLLMGAYILSFYNIENPVILQGALRNMFGIITSFMLFYMTSNFIRSEEQLRTFVRVLAITIALCIGVAFWELFVPGRPLIPHWILIQTANTARAVGYRVGGPFYDFELMGEFMATSFFLAMFVQRQAHGPNQRFFGGALSILSVFVLLATITRGAALSFMGGLVYLLWLIRKKLKFRDLVSITLTGLAIYFLLEFVIAHFTTSGSVLDRLLGTKFVGGLPESRSHWPIVFRRAMEHPFVGHGPMYDLGLSRGITGKGLYTYMWPHNQYLYYLHTVGILGLSAFLFTAVRLLVISFKERAVSLEEPSYARSLMLALHVMLLIFLVDEIKIDHLRNSIYLYYPWILMGLIVATHRIVRQQDRAGRET